MHVPLPKQTERFQFTPAQVLVLGFAGLILIGTILLTLPAAHENHQWFPVVDALFTSTSAVCVTGLVVVDTASHFSTFGEVVIMCLIQAGGLGIMTLSALMLLLMGRRISLHERLLMQEALGSFSISGVVRLTRNIIFTTLAIEGTGAAILSIRWLFQHPWKEAVYWGIFHSVSAFNNAGFDITTESLRPFAKDPLVLFVIGGLIILGGIGFPVMEEVWRLRRWEKLSLHSRLVIKVTLWMIGIGTLLILAAEWTNLRTFAPLPWYHKLSNAWFTAVTPRTAGFESVVTGSLRDVTLLITILLMFIGASPGGTGGGIKTTTFSMLALTVRSTATGKEEVVIMRRRIPKDLIEKAVAITAIALMLVTVVTGALLVTEVRALEDPNNPMTFLKVLFEVVSAFGTVGLTAGLTPLLSVAGKVLITLTMFIGRVGPLTMAVALAQRKFNRSPIHYPEDRVMIG
jgi:trk system potassium uptake protein TrkH